MSRITGKFGGETGRTEDQFKAIETMDVETAKNSGEVDTHRGVSPLSALLHLAQPADDASQLPIVAGDGYEVEVDPAEIRACNE